MGQIALALALLMGAGLMVRGVWNLQQVNLGFEAAGVTTMQVALPTNTQRQEVALFQQRLQAALERLPGMETALASGLPPNRPPNDSDTDIAGFVPRPGGPIQNVEYYQGVSPSYRSTMGIPLIAGRWFDQRDGATSTPVVVVNERMAETFWPGQSPLGRQVQPGERGAWATVIGEVADVKNKGVEQAAGTELYFPLAQTANVGFTTVNILTRSATLSAGSQIAAVRGAVQGLDAAVPLARIESMDAVLARAESRPRFLAWLLLLFAGVSLALAAVGIYGVMSYTVAQRRRELGLRSAIGAAPGDLMRQVLGQGCMLAGLGIVVGGGLEFAASGALRGLVYGLSPNDPATMAAMAAVLAIVAVGACTIPAWRAMRTDPIAALRED